MTFFIVTREARKHTAPSSLKDLVKSMLYAVFQTEGYDGSSYEIRLIRSDRHLENHLELNKIEEKIVANHM